MKMHMIDYVGVKRNNCGGWDVKYNRLSRKKLSCRSADDADIIKALCGWGVIRNTSDYEIKEEFNQKTVFDSRTDRPICALFRF